ncbi:MAG: hypothetical protein RMM29_08545 [Planctomycetota bacterium]|nr:hypothetical protein [Planctomycetota bacterium]
MIRHLAVFLAAAAGGALLALLLRAAAYDPHASHPPPAPPAAPAEHPAEHAVPTVNRICPICGMPVDPRLPTALYQGQRIGFGCSACPEEFARAPERYGPAALANRVAGD